MRVSITRIDPSLPLPSYQSPGATGFDFVCRTTETVAPGDLARLPTNVIVRVPEGFVLVVSLRSGTPRSKGLLIPHGVGIIDQDYCGPNDEILVQVYNFSSVPVTIERGERIAQGLFVPISRCEWREDDAPAYPSRGGFGSTG